MITDYMPGAYMTHDMLHMRGGHQVSWVIDGVPIPNTNIASNLGPQIDPKDIDYLEVQRGSYDADYGDRTYGVFNVVPRTGFEREQRRRTRSPPSEISIKPNDQISFGSHTERFAYYASLNGNRSNLRTEDARPASLHDAENGYGGFASLIFNRDPKNQLRLVTSLRRDYYQIPYDPNPNGSTSSGAPRRQRERDGASFSPGSTPSIRICADRLAVLPLQQRQLSKRPERHARQPPRSTVARNYGGAQAGLERHVARKTTCRPASTASASMTTSSSG